MKLTIDAASGNYGKSFDKYISLIESAGFDTKVDKSGQIIRLTVNNFDFKNFPNLVDAINEDVVVCCPEKDICSNKDTVRLVIYDDWME